MFRKDSVLRILNIARSAYNKPKGVPIPEHELQEQEKSLGYRLPTIIRDIYREFGTIHILRLLTDENAISMSELHGNHSMSTCEKPMHMFDGRFLFHPSEEEDPPVYYLENETSELILVSKSISQFYDFVTSEFERIVIFKRMELIRERLILAEIGDPIEFVGWPESEIRDLEIEYGVKLPSVFRMYLKLMGKAFPPMKSDLYLLPYRGRTGRKVISRHPNKSTCVIGGVPKDAFFFSSVHGTDDCYFRLMEGENPPIYSEEAGGEICSRSLSFFLYVHYRQVLELGGRLEDVENDVVRGRTWKLYQKLLL